jgi:hypothetical protein
MGRSLFRVQDFVNQRGDESMAFPNSNINAVLINNCQDLENLTVTLQVTQDLITLGDTGFSLQLNCYPPPGVSVVGLTLNWIQFILYVSNTYGNNTAAFQWQAWALGAGAFPQGQPQGTTQPQQPVPPFNQPPAVITDVPSNRLPNGSSLTIALTTDPSSLGVTAVTFTVQLAGATAQSVTLDFPASIPFNFTTGSPGVPVNAQFPIAGFQVNLVGPGNIWPCTFTSGAGELTYSVLSGSSLSVQNGGVGTACGQYSAAVTGETSNVAYGGVTPSSGSTVSQTFSVPSMGMEFKFEKSTFGQDEVTQYPTWGSAYWLSISGFPNSALGFNSPSDLSSANPSPLPTVTAAINQSLNLDLTPTQIATIGNNLPVVNSFGLPPVLAIDDTLELNFQTFLYPFTISFPNQNAFNALNPHQVAIVTLTSNLTVQAPTGRDSSGNITTTAVPLQAQANIELAKGEDPYFTNYNPQDPQAYPSWLSFDVRLFNVTPNQPHLMFSVPNPTDASKAVAYIQQVLNHLNNPTLITNGDTFDNALTQDEEGSAIVFYPNDDLFVPTFNFAVARVRITSSITTTIGLVRVFFRLFNAASTVSDFTEVGTGEGTYRWGTNGTPGHKIPLLGVQGGFLGLGAEYVTVPCFATERVNLTSPADMKMQTDPPNAVMIRTAAGKEVDTYFGCWLDVNQTTPFLIPAPPPLQLLWDGPWAGTESLNGVVAAAPHQCLVAEIRFDDTPIQNGTTTGTSQLAQRNIAWLGVQP